MKKIYTDGACKGNPGKGGWGFLILDGEDKILSSGSGNDPQTTNQRMELKAVIEALKSTPINEMVSVYSDSAYVVNCFEQKWMEKWKMKNWITTEKKPVANKDLWEELDVLVQERVVTFVKVKGHDNDQFNIKVDKLAVDASKRKC